METNNKATVDILTNKRDELYENWMKVQLTSETLREDLLSIEELKYQSKEFINSFVKIVSLGNLTDIESKEYEKLRDILDEISKSRVQQGFTPSETATYIFSLKEPLFKLLEEEFINRPEVLSSQTLILNQLLDKLGLYTFESYVKVREGIILRQQQEILELSTPVIHVWDGILSVPIIGTLDSNRSQIIMENLLKEITATGSQIAILDISGVPAMDTLVAHHLMKTVKAARLMGAECIISGIRPAIAQTIVHLGVDLSDVITKATLAGALSNAFKLLGIKINKTER